MKCWKGGRRCTPLPNHHRQGLGTYPEAGSCPWLSGLWGVSQVESAHLASGKGRPMMLRAWACLEGYLLSLHTWLEGFMPRRVESLGWQGRRVTGSMVRAESAPSLE